MRNPKERMKLSIRHACLALAFLLMGSPGVLAQEEDVSGSKDHPLISRFPGSWIGEYSQKEFDEYELILGKIKSEKGENIAERTQHLEGKVTHILYRTPQNRSVLEVYRNYEMALTKAGFQTLYSCRDALCGEWANLYGLHFDPSYNVRHLVAKLSRPEGDAYVTLHISVQKGTEGFGFEYVLDVIEIKPMEAGLVTVNAETLAGDIARTGHVAVYGIYFDTGKAEVKAESEAALNEIAKLLRDNPKLKLHVVGHTDSVGELAMNMDLSRRRAEAVVQALTTKHKIAAARLRGDGVGPLAPVASNDSEEGRAKNRRVELVKQ